MIKNFIKTVASLLVGLLVASCGGNSKSGVDTVTVNDSTVVEIADASAQLWLLKADSIYSSDGISLKVGTPIKSLPSAIDGLYDKIDLQQGMDGIEYNFIKDGLTSFVAMDFGEAKADMFMIVSDKVKVETPLEGVVALGSPFEEIVKLPGVKTEWVNGEGNEGSWYWVWEGLWFAPNYENMSESLAKKINSSSAKFSTEDFTASTIGYIGTGLPY